MNKKTITDVNLAGFAANAAKQGEIAAVAVRHWATSDLPIFYVYAEQLDRIFFPEPVYPPLRNVVNYYLVVLHPDNTADVYWDDFKVMVKVRINRAMNGGELVYVKDIDEVAEVRFPDIDIKPDDRVIYLARQGWRFGILFDLTMKMDIDELAVELARLQSALVLDDVLERTIAELKAKENAPRPYDAFVITEGKTDVLHLEKAFGKLKYACHLQYPKTDGELGDKGLLAICQRAAHLPLQEKPVVCIFDRDNPDIAKELRKQAGGKDTEFQSWGNNVFSMMLPRPAMREGYDNISIELYYPDEVLRRTTADGRRLVFDNELKVEKIPGENAKRILIEPVKAQEATKKVYATDVDSIEDGSGRKVAISKTVFAEMIRDEEPPFVDVSFEPFRSIAEVIDKILLA